MSLYGDDTWACTSHRIFSCPLDICPDIFVKNASKPFAGFSALATGLSVFSQVSQPKPGLKPVSLGPRSLPGMELVTSYLGLHSMRSHVGRGDLWGRAQRCQATGSGQECSGLLAGLANTPPRGWRSRLGLRPQQGGRQRLQLRGKWVCDGGSGSATEAVTKWNCKGVS